MASIFDRPRPPAEDTAYREGRRSIREEALNFLHAKYMSDEAIDKNTPEGEAILRISTELSAHLRSLPE